MMQHGTKTHHTTNRRKAPAGLALVCQPKREQRRQDRHEANRDAARQAWESRYSFGEL